MTLGGSECVKSSDSWRGSSTSPRPPAVSTKLIVPGDPDNSWLYLKVTGKAATAGCVKSATADCTTDSMPYGGASPSRRRSKTRSQVDQDGAVAPQ